MKTALLKDTVREIKRTAGRFLSIFAIVALGCGFFAGIKATMPDMVDSANDYFEQNHLMDYKMVSTVGVRSEDVEAVKKADNAEGVCAGYSKEVFYHYNDQNYVLKALSYSETSDDNINKLNRPVLVEGRFPEKAGECMIENKLSAPDSFRIGNTIELKDTDETKELTESLGSREYEIVGICVSPMYIGFKRDNTKAGNGSITCNLYLPESEFRSGYYTELYVRFRDVHDIDQFSDEYKDRIKDIKGDAFDRFKKSVSARYDKTKAQAERELAYAKQQMQSLEQMLALDKNGLEALDDCAEALDCGYTCANFCVTGGEPVFQPWRILDAGDLKIGFVGAVTPDAYTKSTIKDILNEAGEPMYDFLADETGQRLCVGLQKAIDETRQAGADYVILVSHLGNNDSITEQFRTDAVVGKLRGLDLIIDGHSHETYNRTVTDGENRQVPIAQTGSNMKAIGQTKIYKDGRLEETLIDTVPEPANMPFEKVVRRNVERCVDPEMKAFLDEIVASYAPVMNRKVGEVSYDMIVRDADGFDVSRVEENGLCDFVADAYRTVGGTRAALVNAGAVRNNLKAGTVTYNDILNILPYSNDIVTVRVSGQMLLDALEFGVSKLPAVSGGFLQVSGITFRVNPELESSVVVDDKNQFVSVAGEYRVSDVMVGQEPLDQKAEYTLTGTSFLLNGGDGYAMFKEADILSMTTLPDNEVVIKYLEEYLDGVILEDYREAQGRILITPAAGE